MGVAGADANVIQITSNLYEDGLPDIEGNRLVWQGRGNSPGAISSDADWEVFCYNTETRETRQITDNDYDDVSSQTDGINIVWQGAETGEWDIFLWDGDSYFSISDGSVEDTYPQIASGLIVWDAEPFGESFAGPGEIVLYDIAAGTKTILSQRPEVDPDNIFDDSLPKINGTEVLWIQTDDNDNTRLFVYDHATGAITQPSDYPWKDNPQIEGTLSVLSRFVGNDREIFVHKSRLGTYEQITDNDLQDRYPRISGGNIVWMAEGEIFLAEYKYVALISPANDVVLPTDSPPPTFTWEAVGYDTFSVEFSGDPNFLSGRALASSHGERVASSLSEMSLTPTEEEWKTLREMAETSGRVYWRVEGGGIGENLSETRSFTIEKGEAAVAATTGDTGVDKTGGDSGPCFIGTVAY
jgi:hypothetical protein